MIAVICGGVGAARFLTGLCQVVDPSEVIGIVNVGDDSVMHGLHISPDLDTITYTLAGSMNSETGWGPPGRDMGSDGNAATLRSGQLNRPDRLRHRRSRRVVLTRDKDLGTHLYRTSRLASGAPLSQVTNEITQAWGLELRLVPVPDRFAPDTSHST